MNENEIKELLPLYALGALDEDEHKAVSEYLKLHPEMHAELSQHEDTASSIHGLNISAPDGIIDNIMKEIEKPTIAERIRELLFPQSLFAKTAYAALAAIFVLFLIFSTADKPAIVAMKGTDAAPKASGTLTINDEKHASLSVYGLPQLSPEKTYQLWLIKDGKRTNGGTFDVADGKAVLAVSSAASFSSYDAYGITIEPAGGSQAPTGKKILGS